MAPKTVLILTPDPTLADTLAIHLGSDGYRIMCRDSGLGMVRLLQETAPDLLIVSLPDNPIRGNWRLVEEVHNDPTIETRVIAIVEPQHCDALRLAVLKETTAAVLPLLFDEKALLDTVHRIIGPATDRVSHVHKPVSQWRWRSRTDQPACQEMTPEQVDRIMLGLGRSGMPSDTLERVDVLSQQERDILERNQFLTDEERQEALHGIDTEMERLWAQRRKDLQMMDPNLRALPPSVRAPSPPQHHQVEPHES